jgi:hypothetical protein
VCCEANERDPQLGEVLRLERSVAHPAEVAVRSDGRGRRRALRLVQRCPQHSDEIVDVTRPLGGSLGTRRGLRSNRFHCVPSPRSAPSRRCLSRACFDEKTNRARASSRASASSSRRTASARHSAQVRAGPSNGCRHVSHRVTRHPLSTHERPALEGARRSPAAVIGRASLRRPGSAPRALRSSSRAPLGAARAGRRTHA